MDGSNGTRQHRGQERLCWDGCIKVGCLRMWPIAVRNRTLAAFPLQLFNQAQEDVQVDGIEVYIVQLGVHGVYSQEIASVLSASARTLIAERKAPITGVDNFLIQTALLVPARRAKIATVRQKIVLEGANCPVVFSMRLFYAGGVSELALPAILVDYKNICYLGLIPGRSSFQIDCIGTISFENGPYLVNAVDYKMSIIPEHLPFNEDTINLRATYEALHKEVRPGCEHCAGKFIDIRMHSLAHEAAEKIINWLTVYIVGCNGKIKDTLFELSMAPVSERIEVTLQVRAEKIYERVYLQLIRKVGKRIATWQKDFQLFFL